MTLRESHAVEKDASRTEIQFDDRDGEAFRPPPAGEMLGFGPCLPDEIARRIEDACNDEFAGHRLPGVSGSCGHPFSLFWLGLNFAQIVVEAVETRVPKLPIVIQPVGKVAERRRFETRFASPGIVRRSDLGTCTLRLDDSGAVHGCRKQRPERTNGAGEFAPAAFVPGRFFQTRGALTVPTVHGRMPAASGCDDLSRAF